jgi:YjbE family integral membrane protein
VIHNFDLRFLLNCLSIVLIDILLAGDNAVVIAMAVQSLSPEARRAGISIGAGAAVVLRVIITFFAAQLLLVPFVKLIGGVLILWIGVKLLAESPGDAAGKEADRLWQAIFYIMVADITMSTDNILAVAGASGGSLGLLIFGLGLSIPFVVFTSSLLARIMHRYPIIVWLGAAVLGRVGGEMIVTDPYVIQALHPSAWMSYGVQALFAVAVLAAGRVLWKRPAAVETPVS